MFLLGAKDVSNLYDQINELIYQKKLQYNIPAVARDIACVKLWNNKKISPILLTDNGVF